MLVKSCWKVPPAPTLLLRPWRFPWCWLALLFPVWSTQTLKYIWGQEGIRPGPCMQLFKPWGSMNREQNWQKQHRQSQHLSFKNGAPRLCSIEFVFTIFYSLCWAWIFIIEGLEGKRVDLHPKLPPCPSTSVTLQVFQSPRYLLSMVWLWTVELPLFKLIKLGLIL